MTIPESLIRQLFPVLGEEFVASYWPNRAHDEHGPVDRLQSLLSAPELASVDALCDASCHKSKVVFTNRQGRFVEMQTESPSQAGLLGKAGLSVCLDHVLARSPIIAEWTRQLARELGVPEGGSTCNAYASPKKSGFAQHFDSQEVFIVQVTGEKRWVIADNADVAWPEQNYSPFDEFLPPRPFFGPFHLPEEMPNPSREVIMRPGSVLFLPRGTWHATSASGEERSLSLTFTFSPRSWKQSVRDVLETSVPELRAPLPIDVAARREALGSVPRAFGDFGATLLAWYNASLHPASRRWRRQPAASLTWAPDPRDERLAIVTIENEAGQLEEIEADRPLLSLCEYLAAVDSDVTVDIVRRDRPQHSPEVIETVLDALADAGLLEEHT